MIFIPINLNKRHWSFLIILNSKRGVVIKYYDSLIKEFDENLIIKKYLTPIKKFLMIYSNVNKKSLFKMFKTVDFVFVKDDEFP